MLCFSSGRRLFAIGLAAIAISLGALTPAVHAAEPYQIDTILSLTGTGAFTGSTQLQALKALEGYVNKTGGIAGRPVAFAVQDDQSNPQVALQIAQGYIAQHTQLILGPSLAAACGAVSPLVVKDGPVLYCLTGAVLPVPGSYVFATLASTQDQIAVAVRYLRERGWKRIAFLLASDAGGQDAERGLLAAFAEPENTSMQIVSRQHFAINDISVTAQMAVIKAANPDAVFAWTTGTSAGTLFHGARDAGIDLPTITSPGNLNAAFFKQYVSIFPKSLFIPAVPFYGGSALSNPATKSALAALTSALAGAGAKPDQIEVSAWDPGLLLVDALRKLGTDASTAKLHDYLVTLKGWVGANGPYDFRAIPQRGLGESNVVMVKWAARNNEVTAVSQFGGRLLAGK